VNVPLKVYVVFGFEDWRSEQNLCMCFGLGLETKILQSTKQVTLVEGEKKKNCNGEMQNQVPSPNKN